MRERPGTSSCCVGASETDKQTSLPNEEGVRAEASLWRNAVKSDGVVWQLALAGLLLQHKLVSEWPADDHWPRASEEIYTTWHRPALGKTPPNRSGERIETTKHPLAASRWPCATSSPAPGVTAIVGKRAPSAGWSAAARAKTPARPVLRATLSGSRLCRCCRPLSSRFLRQQQQRRISSSDKSLSGWRRERKGCQDGPRRVGAR